MTSGQVEALLLVREAALTAREAGELPQFLGELERLRVEVLLTPVAPPVTEGLAGGDRLLSTAETAKRLGRSEWWVRSNKTALPLVRLPTGGYGFSDAGLSKWLARRQG